MRLVRPADQAVGEIRLVGSIVVDGAPHEIVLVDLESARLEQPVENLDQLRLAVAVHGLENPHRFAQDDDIDEERRTSSSCSR